MPWAAPTALPLSAGSQTVPGGWIPPGNEKAGEVMVLMAGPLERGSQDCFLVLVSQKEPAFA